MFEKRVGGSAYLSSSGTARGGPHLSGLSGVLSACHVEAALAGTCSGPHAARGAGQTRSDSNVGCLVPTTDGRWLIMPRYTEPEAEQALLLYKLKLNPP